ncbi:hypothetical protein RSOL_460160 [Rhizoctonia solani AG-3 Rhs1AP]|uniref:F-box-like domain protein n=1 Tax=Rhizoctonia solani AG-3 Rhs1AP TaxID=1086054 RepID=X8JGJ6_9AGAM|nr:hypothetical protein RSOL_460160 [Rhizoctonia solani AG-3 Rhs1AP]
MANLPPELIPFIIPDHTTSLALTLVNKCYNGIVTPILHRHVHIEQVEAIRAFSETMVTGRPILCEYPMLLDLSYWPGWVLSDEPYFLVPEIKQILVHLPNLTCLRLSVEQSMTSYLTEESQFPFKLHRLEIMPIKDASFTEFLKAQSEIEEVSLWVDDEDSESQWCADTTPLLPDILPKLRWIQSGSNTVSSMAPHRPVAYVHLIETLQDLKVHREIAKSLVPLEHLNERIELWEQPWESGIVSRCLPSLNFCWDSLSTYSLQICLSRPGSSLPTTLSLLKAKRYSLARTGDPAERPIDVHRIEEVYTQLLGLLPPTSYSRVL